MSMEKESTVLLGENKILFKTWKSGKQKRGITISWDIIKMLIK